MLVTKPVKKSDAGKIVTVVKSVEAQKATKPVVAAKPTIAVVKSDAPDGVKYCKRHDTFHSLDSFANDRSSKDGKYSICKDAEREDRAAKKLREQASTAPAPVAAAPVAKKGKTAKK